MKLSSERDEQMIDKEVIAWCKCWHRANDSRKFSARRKLIITQQIGARIVAILLPMIILQHRGGWTGGISLMPPALPAALPVSRPLSFLVTPAGSDLHHPAWPAPKAACCGHPCRSWPGRPVGRALPAEAQLTARPWSRRWIHRQTRVNMLTLLEVTRPGKRSK